MCEMHYARNHRHGDPLTLISPHREHVKYRAAHVRVAQEFGRAREHQCVDCGRPAHHWSYTHTDDDPLIDGPTGLPYSLDTVHYEPRCASCHARYDMASSFAADGMRPARRLGIVSVLQRSTACYDLPHGQRP